MYGIMGREASILTFNTLAEFEFVLTRHEMTAGVVAAAITRFTKKPQVCFGTVGPGITNYMTALGTAALDRNPVIVIVAQIEVPYAIHNDAHQCVDNVSLAKPLAKYVYEIKSSFELKFALESAIKASMTFPCGPSVISIPIDILDSEVEIKSKETVSLNKEILLQSVAHDSEADDLIKKAAEIIKSSKNPLIIVGDAAAKTNGVKQKVRDFSISKNIPILTTYSAKGILEWESELNFGVISLYIDSVVEQKANDFILGTVDTIIFIGYDLCESHPFVWSSNSVPKTFININSYHNNVHRALKPRVNIISDMNKSIGTLKSCLKGYKNEKVTDISNFKNKLNRLLNDKTIYAEGITHPQVINALSKHFNNDYILASDIGMHRHLSSIFYKNNKPENFVTSEGLSSFGTGLSLGMGSKIANPKENVVMIAGDGGFHSNDGDLETVVRLGLKMLIIILNNNCYALIERYQLTGRYLKINKKNTSFGKVDFVMLAKANGCRSGVAKNLKEFNKLLKKYDKVDEPFLIEVPVYYPKYYVNEYSK
jgi:thiamine pyrophosphate-dependent acetolactate synthase large subunit-like protein